MELWESCRAATDARYVVVWADDQTCRNLWWLKFRHPEKMASGICINGELHGLMHQEDGIWINYYATAIQPFELHLGIKGLGLKLLMKNHNTRDLWLSVIVSAGFVWLKGIDGMTEELLADPVKLLSKVRANLPVYDFVGFLLYFGLAHVAYKNGVRTSHSKDLDFLWQYGLFLYGRTGKVHYRKACLRMLKIIKDSEPNVQAILKLWRTFTRLGKACCGEGFDDLNEQVRPPLHYCSDMTCPF